MSEGTTTYALDLSKLPPILARLVASEGQRLEEITGLNQLLGPELAAGNFHRLEGNVKFHAAFCRISFLCSLELA